MSTFSVPFDDDQDGTNTVLFDTASLDPEVMIEALTRGLTEMFQDRYNEAKANLADSVRNSFNLSRPEVRRVA